MAENQILPFAQGQGANVLSQTDYAGDSMRLQGHQPGVARSALENKALLQCSSMAAGLAQFIADGQADDVTDTKTPAEIAAMLGEATSVLLPDATATVAGKMTLTQAQEQARLAFPIEQLNSDSGYIKLPAEEGKPQLIIQWGGAAITTQTQTVLFPIAFPNAALRVVASVRAQATYADAVISTLPSDKTGVVFGSAAAPSRLNADWVAIGY